MGTALTAKDATEFERCVTNGGVAVFPADTVYGLACDPEDAPAVARLNALKRRPVTQPAAVMFFDLERALAGLPDVGRDTRLALEKLLPGPVTLLLPNSAHRFPLACGATPAIIGLRVPLLLPPLAALGAVQVPVLQSSANRSGEPPAATVSEIPESVRAGADLFLDAGRLPGTASTVIDLTEFERMGEYRVLRAGAAPEVGIAERLAALP